MERGKKWESGERNRERGRDREREREGEGLGGQTERNISVGNRQGLYWREKLGKWWTRLRLEVGVCTRVCVYTHINGVLWSPDFYSVSLQPTTPPIMTVCTVYDRWGNIFLSIFNAQCSHWNSLCQGDLFHFWLWTVSTEITLMTGGKQLHHLFHYELHFVFWSLQK